jgi:hypothetical protein
MYESPIPICIYNVYVHVCYTCIYTQVHVQCMYTLFLICSFIHTCIIPRSVGAGRESKKGSALVCSYHVMHGLCDTYRETYIVQLQLVLLTNCHVGSETCCIQLCDVCMYHSSVHHACFRLISGAIDRTHQILRRWLANREFRSILEAHSLWREATLTKSQGRRK